MSAEEEKDELLSLEKEIEEANKEVEVRKYIIEKERDELRTLCAKREYKLALHYRLCCKVQTDLWAKESKKFCPECRGLKMLPDFKYLFLTYLPPRSSYDSSPHQWKAKIIHICQECREKILTPAIHGAYLHRWRLEKQGGKFFISHQGKYNSSDKSLDEVLSDHTDDHRITGREIEIATETSEIPKEFLTVGKKFVHIFSSHV